MNEIKLPSANIVDPSTNKAYTGVVVVNEVTVTGLEKKLDRLIDLQTQMITALGAEPIPDTPFYWNGTSYIEWVEGLSDGSGTVLKAQDRIVLSCKAPDTSPYKAILVSDTAVDLTNLSKISFEYSSEFGSIGTGSIRFQVSRTKNDDTDVLRTANINTNDSNKVVTLDVSTLTGNHYIKARVSSAQSQITNKVIIHKVWGVGL